ncbi:MAG: site-specific integrase, partial [Prevotellaceae bacterium]|nr:site-specific integrase [Prevotellaceae bacterium]
KIEAFVLSDNCSDFQTVGKWNSENASSCLVEDFIRAELRRRDASLHVVTYHNSLITRLNEFGKIKAFADLTYANISDFDGFLRQTVKSQPTLYKRHSALKRIIKEAIKRKMCNYNPYDDFEFKKGNSKSPVFLDEVEINMILEYQPINKRMEHVKDLFVFQIFTGTAYVDMAHFNKSYISEVNGQKVIRSNRQKTDQSFISLLLPQAEKIIKKYDYKLPIISNQKYNDYLKLLAVGAGITKNLTTHTARHTFATYLLNKDIPIESVSRAMGHSNIKMTEHYAKMLGRKVIKDMEILL